MRWQVYNVRQAKMDIDAVYSMGLFDDVTILPQPAEDSTLEHPKVRLQTIVCAVQGSAYSRHLVASKKRL